MNTNNNNDKQKGLSWSTPAGQVQNAPKPAATPISPIKAGTSTDSKGAAKIAGWLAVGVVAGVVIAWGATSLVKRGDTPVNGNLQNATSTDTGATSDTSTSLTVPSPQKAGLSVAIDKVVVSEPTWVVVYEARDGKPGNVLGAAIFSADHSSGTVDLLRGTLAGQTYFVTEQTDNGDRKFSLKDDTLVTVDGQPTWVSFTAN